MKYTFLIIIGLGLFIQCRSVETIQVSKSDKNLYRVYRETGAEIKSSGVEHCKFDPKTETLEQCKIVNVNYGF